MLGSLLSAPAAAAGAMRQMADGAQYAQTVDEDELGSGFWTELPTEDALLPTPPPAAQHKPGARPAPPPSEGVLGYCFSGRLWQQANLALAHHAVLHQVGVVVDCLEQ